MDLHQTIGPQNGSDEPSASPPTGLPEPGVSEGRLPITAKLTESDGDGEVSLVTSFNPLSFLLTLTHTTVELDGEHHRAPWGRVRFPVAAGHHRLSVSFRYLGRDAGPAHLDVEVAPTRRTLVRYRAPWVVFLRGRLLVVGDEACERATDPTDPPRARHWDGERWTDAVVRPPSTLKKVGAIALAGVLFVVGLVIGSIVVGARADSAPEAADRLVSEQWVTVDDVDGLRFEMPSEPSVSTQPVPGTDQEIELFAVERLDVSMVANASSTLVPGDTWTETEMLDDVAAGMAAATSGTIVSREMVVVDGRPGLDLEMTSPQEGGVTMLGRAVLDGNQLVQLLTVFKESERDSAEDAHDRMASSLRFED